jgi:hypothetical protein
MSDTERIEQIAARLLALWPDDFVNVSIGYLGYRNSMEYRVDAISLPFGGGDDHFQVSGTFDEIEAAIAEVEGDTQISQLQMVLAAVRAR